MYDTLGLWYNGAGMKLAPLLSNTIECRNDYNSFLLGKLGNLKVTLTEQGIKIQGSLSKWYLKNNIQTFTRIDVKNAIEALSDTLKIPLEKARITRMDVGHNFITKYSPSAYFYYLGPSSRYRRSLTSSSLYYSNSLRTKLFYDKIAECKKSRSIVPNMLKNKNLLRFELRFMDKINKAFNSRELLVQILYDKLFFVNIVDKYVSEYISINKLERIAFNKNVNLEPKDILNHLILQGINSLGGQNEVFELIEEARKKNQFKRSEYASRTKRMLTELYNNGILIEPNELIKELNDKVIALQSNYDLE